MYFRYTALNPDNKKLVGTIEAFEEKEARNKLNAFGFSIVDLQTLGADILGSTSPKKDINRYTFEGKDEKKRRVVGSIEASTDEEAYIQLRDEYHLDVQHIFLEGIQDVQKEAAKSRLKTMRENYEKRQTKHGDEARLKEESLRKERSELLQTVNQTIQTVQEFLEKYQKDMKMEAREAVGNYVNQLLRIKDSTNLPHIRRTCELLLDYIQRQDIFLTETQRIKEQTTFKSETQIYLKELKKTALETEITITPFLKRMSESEWFGPFGKFLLSFLAEDEEIARRKAEIKVLHKKMWGFAGMYFATKDSGARHEIKENFSSLLTERKRIRSEIAALRQKQKMAQQEQEHVQQLRAWRAFPLFTGWLLAFYLIFYGITFVVTSKKLFPGPLPRGFYFWESSILPWLLPFLFLFHGAHRLKHDFFSPHWFISFAVYGGSLILYAFFIFNFVW